MNPKFTTLNLIKTSLFSLGFFFLSLHSFAQATTVVHSTNGYDVNVTMNVVRIIAPNSCNNGYNYNTRISYDIAFSGSNIPNALYTLQTNLNCNSNANFTSLPLSGGVGERNTHSNVWNPNKDCGTATPQSLGCNTFTLIIQGPGINYQTINMPILTALPVSLISFDVKTQNSKVVLNWKTSSEVNNAYFNVERSADGYNWEVIKKVDAVKVLSAINEYSMIDNNTTEGLVFYRLTQVDNNGASMTFKQIVSFENTSALQVSIYPNPATTVFNIEAADIENAEVSIIDAMGKTVLINSEIQNNKMTFNTDGLNNGLYVINISLNNEVKSYKITIKN